MSFCQIGDEHYFCPPHLSPPPSLSLSSPIKKGVSHPVNVKIADTEREKEMKRFQHQVQVNQPPSAMAPNVRFSGLAPNIGIDTYSYMRQVSVLIMMVGERGRDEGRGNEAKMPLLYIL